MSFTSFKNFICGAFSVTQSNGNMVTTGTAQAAKILTPEVKTDTSAATDLTLTTGALKTVVLGTSVYDDIIIQAYNLRGGTTPPTYGAFQDTIFGASFINGQTDIVYGSFEVPHCYKEGTNLSVHLHWSPSSTNTGECAWLMKYTFANMNGTFGSEETLNFTQTGCGTANHHQYIAGDTAINGTAKTIKIGSIIAFALSRPTGDAFTGDAFLHSIGVYYEIDTIGSRQETIK